MNSTNAAQGPSEIYEIHVVFQPAYFNFDIDSAVKLIINLQTCGFTVPMSLLLAALPKAKSEISYSND